MAFILIKIFSTILYPIFTSIAVIVAGLFLRCLKKRSGYLLMFVGIVYLYVCSTNQFGSWLAQQVESDYPVRDISELQEVDAILVLGGGVGYTKGVIELNGSADRVLQGGRLLKAGKAPKIVITDGGGFGDRPASEAMAEFLMDLEVPRKSIIEENQALTTYEHTQYLGAIFEEEKIRSVILVTSAWHMRRSIAVFESNMEGLVLIPFPVDSEQGKTDTFLDYLPTVDGLFKTTKILKEYIGYVLYDVRGWID